MSWLPTIHPPEPRAARAQEAILANVHRGMLLATASRRLQDSISAQRASAAARQCLSEAQRLCDETAEPDSADERMRVAIASLAKALEPG